MRITLFFVFGLAVRVFANGPGDLGSIPGRVIPKTQKMVLDASLLNTQHYKVRIKGKVEQSREGVAPSPTPWCSSYRKGNLRVTLDYGRQLYLDELSKRETYLKERLKVHFKGLNNFLRPAEVVYWLGGDEDKTETSNKGILDRKKSVLEFFQPATQNN